MREGGNRRCVREGREEMKIMKNKGRGNRNMRKKEKKGGRKFEKREERDTVEKKNKGM